MKYEDLEQIIYNLSFDEPKTVFSFEGTEIILIRPTKAFKDYDTSKNFQIFLKQGERSFRPNHLRVFIDLNLRVRSRPDLKKLLLEVMDDLFYKKDSLEAINPLLGEHFEHFLNPIQVTSVLCQLFLIEQEHNYTRKSNYIPKTLFYQGWIRQFIDSPKEIDNLVMSVCKGQPPQAKYTSLENELSRKFRESRMPLWYI